MEQSRTNNQQNINSKILNLVKIRGPILPIHASKETGHTLLLTGAFLSTLVSDKALKISNLKVGGSPVYFLPGQEAMLENFIKFLNHKEREAYLIIKEKKVLKDADLSPDIRVAIRNIKDFARSFSLNSQPNEIFWRFFSLTDEELEKEMLKFKMISEIPKPIEQPKPEIKPEIKVEVKPEIKLGEIKIEARPEIKPEIEKPEVKIEEKKIEARPEIKPEVKPEVKKEEKRMEKQIEPIFPFKQEKLRLEIKPKLKIKRKARIKTDKFLEEIKPLLASKNLNLVKIEKYNSKEVNLIAKQNEKEIFILALNKKRIEEADLLKAFRKAQILKLPYLILSKGEMPKKLKEIMEASKSLDRIEKI